MKLRTRLFLWVGIIFFLAFGFSLIFETVITDKNLKEAEVSLRKEILEINEKRRQNVEKFLYVSLSEDQAKIDSLLLRLARDPTLGATLFLDPSNLQLVAPAHSAFLFKNDRWIDLIQTTKDNTLTSLLVPIDFPMDTAYIAPINQTLSWVVAMQDRKIEHPLFGIKLPIKSVSEKNLSFMIDELIETDWGVTVLFDPKSLSTFAPKKMEREKNPYGIDLSLFVASLDEAVKYLQSLKEKGGDWIQTDALKKGKDIFFKEKIEEPGIDCLKQEGDALNRRIIQFLQRGDQAILLSALASLFPGGEFGPSPFSPFAPKGIARFLSGAKTGDLIFAKDVFFQKKVFNDSAYLKQHPGLKECKGIGSSIAVIAPENLGRVFIGNSLELQGNPTQGYLTVAVDADEMVQDLVLSVHKTAFLVHGKKVVSAFSPDGAHIDHPQKVIPFNEKMLKKKRGVIDWKGENYYYQQIVPFKNLDLHFFTLDLEKNAFALVRSIDQGSREMIKTVSINMRLIAVIALVLVLLLLHNVARRITKPIASLARVTEDVASGRLEGIELPTPPKGRHDEIAILCASFNQMIIGLQEKEKVKGVLNKVVSPEIAEEILKGQIHLGGEEKKVTVLFADIRKFTSMSASKDPKEVIEMLNTCMTKVSHVIDEFGGVIDKYVGDEVMALFGAPFEKEDSALKSIQCGLKIIEVLREWNEERGKMGKQPVQMGVGIHTGIVLIGNMGAENRLNYTVIGSNVNLAARLCSAAKEMEILISDDTLKEPHVEESIEIEKLPPIELKGFAKSYVLYRVKGEKHVR